MSTGPGGRGQLIDRFRRSRRDPEVAVVEGFHALKHALRFEAELISVLCADSERLQQLARELAPDIAAALSAVAEPVGEDALAEVGPRSRRTGVVALARRPKGDASELLARAEAEPIVLVEQPRDLNNTGACVRVAAAAGAAGMIVTGRHDPWHPDAIRGAAGLHFALPVLWCRELPRAGLRPLIAFDPDGEPLEPARLPLRATFAFGSERAGLSEELLASADARVRIPMRAGVSSLNLATSVSAALFAMRLCGRAPTA